MNEIERYAIDVFGEKQAALDWLVTPLWELSNSSPQQWLAEKGARGSDWVGDAGGLGGFGVGNSLSDPA